MHMPVQATERRQSVISFNEKRRTVKLLKFIPEQSKIIIPGSVIQEDCQTKFLCHFLLLQEDSQQQPSPSQTVRLNR